MLNGFVEIRQGAKTAWVREPWADCIAAALLEGAGCTSAGAGGRGELLQFPCEGGAGMIRHYRRGGLVRYFLNDIYLCDNRAIKELTLHWALLQEGLSMPEPLGASWQRLGLFYRGWIATRRLDAVELGAFLRSATPDEAARRCYTCGGLVRRMHELGVNHPDLQTGNILIAKDTEYLIDFDRAVRMACLPAKARERNLRRLRRSFLKHGLPVQHYDALRDGYTTLKPPETE